MIPQKAIAEMARVSRPDVSNYLAGRTQYVSPEKRIRIQSVLEKTKTKAGRALEYLKQGHTLTPLQFLTMFGIHAASQQCTKWRARGINVQNIVPEERKFQEHAVYKLFEQEAK